MRISLVRMAIVLATCLPAVAFAADGAAVYKQRCASCHGDTGKADTAAGKALKVPPLAGDAKVSAMSDADIIAKIKTNEKHKSFIAKVSDDDITAVATHVKGLAAAK